MNNAHVSSFHGIIQSCFTGIVNRINKRTEAQQAINDIKGRASGIMKGGCTISVLDLNEGMRYFFFVTIFWYDTTNTACDFK